MLKAFAMDSSADYDESIERKLRPGEVADVFLADLRRLAFLYGGVSEKAFVHGLPERVRHLLRAALRMEELPLSQVLTQARSVLADQRPKSVEDVCLGAKQAGEGVRVPERLCSTCQGLCDATTERRCQQERKRTDPSTTAERSPPQERWPGCSPAAGKRAGREGVNGLPSPQHDMVQGLPTVRLVVDNVERSALVDTGCTRCIAHVSCCRRWHRRTVGMTALNGGQLRGHDVGTVGCSPPGGLERGPKLVSWGPRDPWPTCAIAKRTSDN
uniref:Peptidase A2 domain-containing protein n=1 Tax=Trichuris muris TaxID=70415 RepID=A0A5S6QIM8_TRIMR